MSAMELRSPPAAFAVCEIVGLVPSRDVGDATARQAIRDALAQHGVVCLRFDQGLDDETFRRVAEMFGPIKEPIGRSRDGYEVRYDTEMPPRCAPGTTRGSNTCAGTFCVRPSRRTRWS